jgi:hypothetical protein
MTTHLRRQTLARAGLAVLGALAFSLPVFSQAGDPEEAAFVGPVGPVSSWSTWRHADPTPRPLESYPVPLLDAGTLALVDPPERGRFGFAPGAESLSLSASAAAAPETRGGVERDALDADPGVAYADVPGGIVLGRVARPEIALSAPRLRATGGRLEIVDGAATYPLASEDARFLYACLTFATSGGADHTAIDIRSDGAVVLAPELVDTEVGLALLRCDQLPHELRPDRWNAKSSIVDRDARLRFDAATGELRPTAELELRFSRPTARGAAHWIETEPVTGAMRTELADAARVAAWVAFFRWAHAADPAGVARAAAELADAGLALDATRTPRRVAPRSAGVAPSGYGPRPSVETWMWEHRERVLAER